MTIAELKDLIKDIPDDYMLMIQTCEEYLPISNGVDIDNDKCEVVLYEQL